MPPRNSKPVAIGEPSPPRVNSRLASIRRGRGIGASDLAKRVGVSRQTIHAIESGSYVPNTEVTLKLARELEVPVEKLFSLAQEDSAPRKPLECEVLSTTALPKGQTVKVCQIEDRLISVPVHAAPYYLPEADGVITRSSRGQKSELIVFSSDERYANKLVLAGCDPAIGLVSRMVEKTAGIEIVSAAASSKLALRWLQEGKAHIAGSHLKDLDSGDFNLPFIRREFPEEDFAVVTFAQWEAGFVTAPGNPMQIKKAEDLARNKVRFVNRETGSGSRALLDRLLTGSGIPRTKILGYSRLAHGHLAAAYMVYANEVDCCLATRSAAQAFGLHFVPVQSERYDFVMRRQTMETRAAQALIDVLQRAALRRKLEVLAGYDTSQTGVVLT